MRRVLTSAMMLAALLISPAAAQDESGTTRVSVAAPGLLAMSLLPSLLEGFALDDGARDLSWQGLGKAGEAALVIGQPGRSGVTTIEVLPDPEGAADVTVAMSLLNDLQDPGGSPIARDGIAIVRPASDMDQFVVPLQDALAFLDGSQSHLNLADASLPVSITRQEAVQSLRQNDDIVAMLSTAALAGEDAGLRSLQIQTCGPAYSPTPFAIKTGDYALTREIVVDGSGPFAAAFTDFALSAEGQSLIREAGFVSVEVKLSRPNSIYIYEQERAGGLTFQNATIYRQYLEQVQGARKLSEVVQFNEGGANLSVRAREKLKASYEFLRGVSDDGRDILVFGFADAAGPYQDNINLAQQRAQVVARILGDEGLTVARVMGFGEEMPAACNTAPQERGRNRRVEIWVR